MFLSVWLFPWKLGKGIIVFRTQTETDQIHRQPRDQNRSCGSGTHHALIRFGLVAGLVCVSRLKHPPQSATALCQVVCQNGERFGKESWREKLWAVTVHPPSGRPGPADSHPSSCGFSELRRHFLCGFFNSSTCHLAGSAIVPFPFSPCSFCRDESCHPLVISTFVAFVFGPTSEVHLVFYVPAFHA